MSSAKKRLTRLGVGKSASKSTMPALISPLDSCDESEFDEVEADHENFFARMPTCDPPPPLTPKQSVTSLQSLKSFSRSPSIPRTANNTTSQTNIDVLEYLDSIPTYDRNHGYNNGETIYDEVGGMDKNGIVMKSAAQKIDGGVEFSPDDASEFEDDFGNEAHRQLIRELEECKKQLKRKECKLGESVLMQERLRRENEHLRAQLSEQTGLPASTFGRKQTTDCDSERGDADSGIDSCPIGASGRFLFSPMAGSSSEQVKNVLTSLTEAHTRLERALQQSSKPQDGDVVCKLLEEMGNVRQLLHESEGCLAPLIGNPHNLEEGLSKHCASHAEGDPSSGRGAYDDQEKALIRGLKRKNCELSAEVLDMRQRAILTALTEVDTELGEAEARFNWGRRNEVERLRLEKDKLVKELKKKLKEWSEATNVLSLSTPDAKIDVFEKSEHPFYRATQSDLYTALQQLDDEKSRFQKFVDEVVSVVSTKHPHLLEGLPEWSMKRRNLTHAMSDKILELVIEQELEHSKLQTYANMLLCRISNYNQEIFVSLPSLHTFLPDSSEY